tara:strand:+ start:3395 stop:3739 length:345 start_codon:yes stop_codon:yes gene_type:complete
MDYLLKKRSQDKNGGIHKVNTTTNNEFINKIIKQANYYTFGYIGTLIAIVYNAVMTRGIVGSSYDLFTSSFFFVNKTKEYPNLLLNNIFGFVSKPVERVLHKPTKNTSKLQQST